MNTKVLFALPFLIVACSGDVSTEARPSDDATSTSSGSGGADGGGTTVGTGGESAGQCGGATGPSGDGEIEVGGITRTYELFLPETPAGAPVVFLFHGQGGSGQALLGTADPAVRTPWSLWLDIAAAENLILVVPDALPANGVNTWNDCRPQTPETSDDVGLFDALIDHVVDQYAADEANVFATGFSNGGQLAIRLAEERPERLKAIATISASMSDDTASPCVPSDVPVSALFINGTADAILPYEGGPMLGGQGVVKDVWEMVDIFRARNGVTGPPILTYGPGLAGSWFYGSEEGPAVMLTSITNGGHVEPSVEVEVDLPNPIFGPQNRDVEMAEAVWAFFAPLANPSES